MKKKLALIMAAMLCAAAVFTGCGNQQPSSETSQSSSAAIENEAEKLLIETWIANDILTGLNQDGGFDMTVETQDSDLNTVTLTKSKYTKDGEKITYLDTTTDGTGAVLYYAECVEESKDVAAAYTVLKSSELTGNISGKTMVVMPAAEQLSYLESMNPITALMKAGADEQPVSVSMQDGKQILETTITAKDFDGSRQRYYYLDPETKLADVILTETFDKDGKQTLSQHIDYTKAVEVTKSARKEILDKNGCKLKVVIDYIVAKGSEDKADHFEQEFQVAKDTTVLFNSDSDYKLYSDAEHKNEIESIDVTGKEATVYVLITAVK